MARRAVWTGVAMAGVLLGSAPAQSTLRVSVGPGGVEANDASLTPSLSIDGRWVAFSSGATNLVASDTNGRWDVLVHDRQTNTTALVSVGTSGAQFNGDSWNPIISADGRFVAFDVVAQPFPGNNATSLTLHDRQTGTTTQVASQLGSHSLHGSLSSDGRFIAYEHSMFGPPYHIYFLDRQAGVTVQVDVDNAGSPANSMSNAPSISGDGRLVAFTSEASNLIAGDTNSLSDVYVRDLVAATTVRISVASGGAQASGASAAPAFSADGRFVAFGSYASDLVPGDTNAQYDVFLHELATGTTTRVSLGPGGAQGNSGSFAPSISADGRMIAFTSAALNLVAADTNGVEDAFVHDRVAGITRRTSVSTTGGQADAPSHPTAISGDGRTSAFDSVATNLVVGDSNATSDVFVRDGIPGAPIVYCTSGTTTNGCIASIGAVGLPSASAGSGFTITASQVEGQKQGIIFYGISGRASSMWGSGTSYLCVKSPLQRTAIQSSGGTLFACDGTLALDWNAFIATHPSALGQPFHAGDAVTAQAWFRGPPSPKGTNLSDALEFVVAP